MVTGAPNAAGDTNTFTTGTFSSVSETTLSDANFVSSDTSGQIFQSNLTNLPSGVSFSIVGVKLSARSSKSVSGITSLALGVKTGGTASATAPVALTGAWTTLESYLPLNPISTSPWTMTEANALQLHLESSP